MKKSTKIILSVIAVLLIAVGVCGIIFALIGNGDKVDAESTEGKETEKIHDSVEYIYDADGNIKSEVYYKDNVYNGQKDYFSTESSEYVTVFDADHNQIESSVTELNTVGSISKITTYRDGEVYRTVEYDFAYDLRTVAKKTVKTYTDKGEEAEKTYFDENGKQQRYCTFLNGEITSDTYYDENGNVVENGGETVEE